jgi:hypothetical protein
MASGTQGMPTWPDVAHVGGMHPGLADLRLRPAA